jgi:hypothetical protein
MAGGIAHGFFLLKKKAEAGGGIGWNDERLTSSPPRGARIDD